MTLPSSVRSMIPLVIGLLLGVAGATMFMESMPGSVGSPEEKVARLELTLKQTQNRLAAVEAENAPGQNRRSLPQDKASAADAAKRKRSLASIARDIREGRLVNPDDIFAASQPFLRDVAPLFDRMRIAQQQQTIDSLTGEFARKYNLTPQNKEALSEFFKKKMEADAKRWNDLVEKDGTKIEDLMKVTQNTRSDEGLDAFMGGVLSGEKLAAFQTQRLNEKADMVQREADMRVQRVDSVVGLDESQRDQVFGVMAHTSRDYQPAMVFGGANGQVVTSPGGDRNTALLSVLRPDQRIKYQAERDRRRAESAKQLATMGLASPVGSDSFDEDSFP